MDKLNTQKIHCSHTQEYDPHGVTLQCWKCGCQTCIPCHQHLVDSGDIVVYSIHTKIGWIWDPLISWASDEQCCIECQKSVKDKIIEWFNKIINKRKGYVAIEKKIFSTKKCF